MYLVSERQKEAILGYYWEKSTSPWIDRETEAREGRGILEPGSSCVGAPALSLRASCL